MLQLGRAFWKKAEPATALRIRVPERSRRLARKGRAGLGPPYHPQAGLGEISRPVFVCVCVFFLLKVVWGEVGSNDQSGGLGWKERE